MKAKERISRYVAGESISAIAKAAGVSRQAIINTLKKEGVYGKGVTPQVTPPKKSRVTPPVTPKNDEGVTPVDLYAYAASLPPLEEYDNGAGSICPVRGDRYYFEELDIWLPVVRDEGPLKDHVEYLRVGKRFKRSHPHHPDNAWKRDPKAKHPYEV
jgi:hypothetical protein